MGVCVGCVKREDRIKGDMSMDQLASKVFLVAGCWMPLEQVVGQI